VRYGARWARCPRAETPSVTSDCFGAHYSQYLPLLSGSSCLEIMPRFASNSTVTGSTCAQRNTGHPRTPSLNCVRTRKATASVGCGNLTHSPTVSAALHAASQSVMNLDNADGSGSRHCDASKFGGFSTAGAIGYLTTHWHIRCERQSGNVNAMSSPEYAPPLTARTMYCLPLYPYVIGAPLSGAGMKTAPTSSPVALS